MVILPSLGIQTHNTRTQIRVPPHGAVVHAQVRWGAALGDEALDDGDDAVGVDAVRGVDGQGFSGELVDDVEQLDAPQAGDLVELEIQRPHVVGALGA